MIFLSTICVQLFINKLTDQRMKESTSTVFKNVIKNNYIKEINTASKPLTSLLCLKFFFFFNHKLKTIIRLRTNPWKKNYLYHFIVHFYLYSTIFFENRYVFMFFSLKG